VRELLVQDLLSLDRLEGRSCPCSATGVSLPLPATIALVGFNCMLLLTSPLVKTIAADDDR